MFKKRIAYSYEILKQPKNKENYNIKYYFCYYKKFRKTKQNWFNYFCNLNTRCSIDFDKF